MAWRADEERSNARWIRRHCRIRGAFVGAAKREIAVICRMVRLGNLAMVLQLLMRAHEQEQTIARC